MNATSKVLRFLPCLLLSLAATTRLQAQDHASFKVGEFTFARPTKWEWVETTSQMRKAQLKVTDAAGKASAEVVFFQFPGSGGSVQANVDRWLGQFEEPKDKINAKTEDITVGKTKVTYVSAEGTYKSGMPGAPATPMTDYALMGAILESADGNVFVRMTGPKALVKTATAEFRKMVESGPKKD